MLTKEEAKERIKALVERFEPQLAHYKRSGYNETQTRAHYINPMFEALGWDIDNRAGLLESSREVIHEARVSTQEGTKAPDYCFTIYGKEQFYLEAQKPAVVIKDNNKASYQIRNYGWNKKFYISLLTDFEELAVYDCTFPPKDVDGAHVGRLKIIHFTDYEKEFDYIWEHFSKEAVFAGSLDVFASNADKKGAESVDEHFLRTLESFRLELATAIYTRNKALDEEQIKFAVQAIINRLVFLRICEDRGIETFGKMRDIASKTKSDKLYGEIFACFKEADEKYNSGLFSLKNDNITPHLKMESKVLRNIVLDLYPPNSPYLFAVMPADILGNAYEQFLGKVIILNSNGSVSIEPKMEVRKAGGVYYTPQYIVEYMVESTLGAQIRAIEAQFPLAQVGKEVGKLKICDPSCGSGSFLLGIYQYLLRWYHSHYHALAKEQPQILQQTKSPLTAEGNLSSLVKKEILLQNIFGVDLDANAVEVTKLSLLLKAMEGETDATVKTSLTIYRERVLPTLDENVRCGNSLIDVDFYENNLEIEASMEKKIKPFNWQSQFKPVFAGAEKGFDFIIGNPPYINIENLSEENRSYYLEKYQTCEGRTDIYIAFIEKGLQNLKTNGMLSFIIPYAFTNQNYGRLSREMLVKNYFVRNIVDTSAYMVFKQANVKNIVLSVQKTENKQNTQINIATSKENFTQKNFQTHIINQEVFGNLKDCRFETKEVHDFLHLRDALWQNAIPLDTICLVAYGARLNHKEKPIGKDAYISTKQGKGLKPFLEGKNIQKYVFSAHGWLKYKPQEHYNAMFPELFENEKIMFINIVKDTLRFAYDNQNFYNSHTVINCVRLDKLQTATHISAKRAIKEGDVALSKEYDYMFLLGLLNSKLINWYFKSFLSEGLHFYPNDAKNLPIIKVEKNDKKQKKTIDSIIEQTNLLRALLEKNASIKNDEFQNNQLSQRIWHAENQIDELILDLYGITEASERALILQS